MIKKIPRPVKVAGFFMAASGITGRSQALSIQALQI